MKDDTVTKDIESVKDITRIEINPEILIQKAIENGSAIDIVERLLDMRDRINKEQAEKDFRQAMADFQGECPVVVKSSSVLNKDEESVRYKYAPLDAIVKTVQPFIKKNGLSYDIDTEQSDKGITVIIRVYHINGHSKDTRFTVPIDEKSFMNLPQKWASAQTFAKRYAFCNAFGILTGDKDDDGIGAGDPESAETKAQDKKRKTNEALTRMIPLSDMAKQGLVLLGYTAITADIFCKKFNYDEKKIMTEINKILDMKEGSK